MAEGADNSSTEDWGFDEDLVDTDVPGYLYEPEYSDEQLRAMEDETAEAAAATDALPAAEEEPAGARAGAIWWCLCSNCAPMDTEQESVCCREFQRCQFLLDEMMESDSDDPDVCVVDHPSFSPHMDSGVLQTYFRIPKVNWKRQPKPTGPNGRLSQK